MAACPVCSSDRIGLPEPASKMWIGWKQCAARVGVEQRQLLLAVHQVVGVVDVEHDRGRRAGVAAAEQIDEAGADPIQRPGIGEVLQARDGRLARNAASRSPAHARRRSCSAGSWRSASRSSASS